MFFFIGFFQIVQTEKKTIMVCKKICEVHLQKQITPFLTIFKNRDFSLCIPINFNQTAVGLF